MDQLLLTEFSQKLLRINIQWWTEFRAALPAGLLRRSNCRDMSCLSGRGSSAARAVESCCFLNQFRKGRHRVCADCYNQMAQPTVPSAEQIGRHFFGGLSVETESLPNRVQLNSINVMEGWSSRLEVLGTRVSIPHRP